MAAGRGSKEDGKPHLGDRYSRGKDLAKLSATTGTGYLAAKLKGWRAGADAETLLHEANAIKILEQLGSMKGAAMKIGQIASFVDLDLPDEVQATYQAVLADLRTKAPAMDADAIAGVIRADFGAGPDEVFAHWDPEPIASASIGQVHRATLPDGTAVVTKVQYPGVAEAVTADLANAEAFAPLVKVVSPNLKVKPLMEELRLRLGDELDYQREAQYTQAFFERYDGHPFIRVPRVHTDWCRPRVLVLDYMEGLGFEDMAATVDEAERQRNAEIIYRFVFGSLHRFRLFNGDPHPGNYLFAGDGTVTFLDFGSVKLFPSAVRRHIQDQLRALLDGDRDALIASMREAGFIPERDGSLPDPGRLWEWFRIFNRPILEDRVFTYTPEFAREVLRTTSDPRGGYVDTLRRLNLPPDYLLLNRIQWGVNSILGRLHATANWHRIAREFWDGLEPSTELGRLEAAFVDSSPFRA